MNEKETPEETIRKNEWKYRLLAENIRDVVWSMDLDGRIICISPSITAQTGYLPEEYYGAYASQFLTPESAARVTAMLRDELSRPPEQRMESAILELQDKDEGRRYHRRRSQCILDLR
jgi:two-component system, sporulation sensor kinase A